jgi:hypothetical protein
LALIIKSPKVANKLIEKRKEENVECKMQLLDNASDEQVSHSCKPK